MTILSVRHVTTYLYRKPVAFGEHRMMFRPRDSYDQRLIDSSHLVHYPSDVGQDARPIHSSSTQADSRLIASKNRSQRHQARLRQEWTTHRLFYSFNFGVEWVSYQT